MSGICGLLRLDGGPAEGLDAMLAPLRRRGPDGVRTVRDGPAALGHALLATTPEALSEVLPWTHAETGCTVTADVRLDNREELIAALGLPDTGRSAGDGELILRAYLRWGEDCPGRLLGDWAFAIWDPRQRRLLAARDQMGLRRLAYAHVPGRIVAFATEPRAVRAAPDVPKDLDEGRIADFLDNERDEIDAISTPYAAVRRLPPAHLLVADERGARVRRYWTLEPGPSLRLPSDAAYAEAFREVFTEAVRTRLRHAGRLGSMMSGGLDSGAIVAVASRLQAADGTGPLPTVSVVGPDPANRAEADAVRLNLERLPGLEPHIADIAEPSAWLPELEAALREIEEPFDSQGNVRLLSYVVARQAGLRVLLDGVSGDVVLTEGARLAHLARAGRWPTLLREAQAEERFWNSQLTTREVLSSTLRRAFVPAAARRLRRAWYSRHWMTPRTPILSPDFARQVNRAGRKALWFRNNTRALRRHPLDRVGAITSLSLLSGQELGDRMAGLFGIERRDPFADLRLIAFCLSCPAEQMSRSGWPKLILRQAMTGLLPHEVAWRPGRTHFGYSLMQLLWNSPTLLPKGEGDLPPHALAWLIRATGSTFSEINENRLSPEDIWAYRVLALWLSSQGRPE